MLKSLEERPRGASKDDSVTCFLAIMAVLIVAGHIPGAYFSGPFGLFPPYSFHVAAFCFASGYLYSPRHDSSVGSYLLGRTQRLLIPMFAMYLVYGLVLQTLKALFGFSFGSILSVESVVVQPLTHGAQFSLNYAMWYIAPFFAAQCTWVFLRSFLLRAGISIEMPSIVLSVLLGAFSVFIGGEQGIGASWLLFSCRTAFLLSWLATGRLYRIGLKWLDKINSVTFLTTTCIIQLAVWYLCDGSPSYTPGWCEYPNGVLLTYLATATGIAFWWRLSRIVSVGIEGQTAAALHAVGSNTFSIMCHHLMGFFALKSLFWMGSILTSAFGLFDAEAFLSNSDYFYYPHGLMQFSLLYVVFGIVFSLVVHSGWMKLKQSIGNGLNYLKTMPS